MKKLLGLAACMLPMLSVAEFVVPIESVEEYVNVRMVPDAKSEIVGRLYQGGSARVVGSMPEWHEIEIAGGATGFISADWTAVVDELPRAAESPAETRRATHVKAGQTSSVTGAAGKSANDTKENVTELSPQEALSALANLEPVTFSYRQDEQERYVGFTSENVPEFVASSESEGLRPLEIVAVLTRIVKLQQHQIAELEARLEKRN